MQVSWSQHLVLYQNVCYVSHYNLQNLSIVMGPWQTPGSIKQAQKTLTQLHKHHQHKRQHEHRALIQRETSDELSLCQSHIQSFTLNIKNDFPLVINWSDLKRVVWRERQDSVFHHLHKYWDKLSFWKLGKYWCRQQSWKSKVHTRTH